MLYFWIIQNILYLDGNITRCCLKVYSDILILVILSTICNATGLNVWPLLSLTLTFIIISSSYHLTIKEILCMLSFSRIRCIFIVMSSQEHTESKPQGQPLNIKFYIRKVNVKSLRQKCNDVFFVSFHFLHNRVVTVNTYVYHVRRRKIFISIQQQHCSKSQRGSVCFHVCVEERETRKKEKGFQL